MFFALIDFSLHMSDIRWGQGSGQARQGQDRAGQGRTGHGQDIKRRLCLCMNVYHFRFPQQQSRAMPNGNNAKHRQQQPRKVQQLQMQLQPGRERGRERGRWRTIVTMKQLHFWTRTHTVVCFTFPSHRADPPTCVNVDKCTLSESCHRTATSSSRRSRRSRRSSSSRSTKSWTFSCHVKKGGRSWCLCPLTRARLQFRFACGNCVCVRYATKMCKMTGSRLQARRAAAAAQSAPCAANAVHVPIADSNSL